MIVFALLVIGAILVSAIVIWNILDQEYYPLLRELSLNQAKNQEEDVSDQEVRE